MAQTGSATTVAASHPARGERLNSASGLVIRNINSVEPAPVRPKARTTRAAALTTYRYRRLRITRRSLVRPPARTTIVGGDFTRAARDPGLPQVPHQAGVSRARSIAMPQLQGALSDRRRHPCAADRRGQAGG